LIRLNVSFGSERLAVRISFSPPLQQRCVHRVEGIKVDFNMLVGLGNVDAPQTSKAWRARLPFGSFRKFSAVL